MTPSSPGARPQFLSARWENLCLFNYAVDPHLLLPFLPPGCTLDGLDGEAYVSLVAFDFVDTRVLGVSWPGFRHFPEINLRFYVREGARRGVSFVAELVPSRLIAFVARALYNEPYRAVPIHRSHSTTEGLRTHRFVVPVAGAEQSLRVTVEPAPYFPAEDSTEHFFKEHQWGVGTSRKGRRVVYEVGHPHWEVCPVTSWGLDWDFGAVYGPDWGFLTNRQPRSVVFALGSAISVRKPTLVSL